jgi:NAD(P)-dependent dehydrogenase (short-subunit alcohol dehydrogenase family)
LQDKVAVVTGAGTGIGQAVALAFAEAGAAVVVDYVGSASVSEDTIKKISAIGGKSLGVDADISRPDDVNELISTSGRRSWRSISPDLSYARKLRPGR